MDRIEVKDLDIVGEHYRTFDEFFSTMEKRPLNGHYSDDGAADEEQEMKDGVKVARKDSVSFVRKGCSDFNEDFDRFKKDFDRKSARYLKEIRSSRNEMSVVGGSVNVPRAMIGHPRSFSRRVADRRKERVIDVMFDCTCAWYVDVKERIKAGCLAMSVVETLEKMGYGVRFVFCPFFSVNTFGGKAQILEIELKGYRTPFSLRKMQFPLASKSTLFHIGCWWHHHSPTCTEHFLFEGKSVMYDDPERAEKYAEKRGVKYLSTVKLIDMDFDFDAVMESIVGKE